MTLAGTVVGGLLGGTVIIEQVFGRPGLGDLTVDAVAKGAVGLRCDVADRSSVQQAVDTAAETLGGIDVVVNNAGVGALGTVADNDDAEWSRVLDVNVTGIARVSAAALPHLAGVHGGPAQSRQGSARYGTMTREGTRKARDGSRRR